MPPPRSAYALPAETQGNAAVDFRVQPALLQGPLSSCLHLAAPELAWGWIFICLAQGFVCFNGASTKQSDFTKNSDLISIPFETVKDLPTWDPRITICFLSPGSGVGWHGFASSHGSRSSGEQQRPGDVLACWAAQA